MNKRTRLLIAMFLVMTWVFNALGQNSKEGGIILSGKVVDEKGNPVKGIEVAIRLYEGSVTRPKISKDVITEENGTYKFEELRPGLYGLYIENTAEVKAISPDKHAFMTPELSPYLYKKVELKETDKGNKLEINFRIVLGAKIEGKVMYEDKSLVTDMDVQVESTDGWGTLWLGKSGSYVLKGLNPENKTVDIEISYNLLLKENNLGYFSDISQIITKISVKEGETTKRDLIIKKPNPNKYSVQGKISAEGILYSRGNSAEIKAKKLQPLDAGGFPPVSLVLESADKTFNYFTYLRINGEYKFFEISPGQYSLRIIYSNNLRALEILTGRDTGYIQGPILAERDVTIEKDKTLTIDANFVLTPQEKVEFTER